MVIMEEVYEVFDNTEEINVYNDGIKTTYANGEKQFKEILTSWNLLLNGSRQMPAFGVSLNRETTKAMKSGLWAEFVFNGTYECNGMPFEKLLVNVEKDNQGFNICRYNSNYGYDGRCFYIDLVNKNMADFYGLLLNL